jgi:hypothetical protein
MFKKTLKSWIIGKWKRQNLIGYSVNYGAKSFHQAEFLLGIFEPNQRVKGIKEECWSPDIVQVHSRGATGRPRPRVAQYVVWNCQL